jgi:hypothetical protein
MSNAAFATMTTAERISRKWNPHVKIWDSDLGAYFSGDGVTLGGVPTSIVELAAVADVDETDLPGDGVIAALTFTATPTGAECEALRAQCEALRDALAATNSTVNTLISRLEVEGVLAT